jgi:hypothetical protein
MSAGLTQLIRSLALMTLIKNLGRHIYVTTWSTIINSEYLLFGLISPCICANWLLNYIFLFDSCRVHNQALV